MHASNCGRPLSERADSFGRKRKMSEKRRRILQFLDLAVNSRSMYTFCALLSCVCFHTFHIECLFSANYVAKVMTYEAAFPVKQA